MFPGLLHRAASQKQSWGDHKCISSCAPELLLARSLSISGWASGFCRPFCACVPTTRDVPGFRSPLYGLLLLLRRSPTFHLHLLQISLKLKEHIHTTSIYTLCFICYKISPLGFSFAFLLCCFVTAYYTSHERLMILNLACFKAFCSFGRASALAVVTSVPVLPFSTSTSCVACEFRSNAKGEQQRRTFGDDDPLQHRPPTSSFKALFLP